MIKTENEIERDFFLFVKNSSLGAAIKGEVYRPDQRPDDAATEDIVVKFYTGIDEQIQSGTVIIDIYVPDIVNAKGKAVKNTSRIGVLQGELKTFIHTNEDTEYLMESEETPYSVKVDGVNQHQIKARVKFQRATF